ncbi:MAG: acyl-CoA thioesterase II [Gammaproteobacteria bacterium]|nr:acyl-CoA thioesterase II [Gammaproteobacteria bacterium]MDP2141031.1 acyl-CoA thioesterase II [Gammaproteobacteria bacterium]MDP2348490.1 acyl-CoA thioesterase II [Gammaproteobacteria bacterium]
MTSDQSNQQLQQLFDHLELETLDVDLYRSTHKNEGWMRVYGGQVLAQALLSASRTVPADRQPHSLHSYFMRPGDLNHPIIFVVERLRDGKSFNTRRVSAMQNGEVILNLAASFQVLEAGLSHQSEMPTVPPPEHCLTRKQLAEQYKDSMSAEMLARFSRPFAIDLRQVESENYLHPEKRPPTRSVWMKLNTTLPDDYAWHAHILAYASDMTILETSLRPHGMSLFSNRLQVASLDHAMWFHRPFRADEWLLYVQDSPSSSAGRGFSRGNIFRQSGELVVSVAQEGLIRVREK